MDDGIKQVYLGIRVFQCGGRNFIISIALFGMNSIHPTGHHFF